METRIPPATCGTCEHYYRIPGRGKLGTSPCTHPDGKRRIVAATMSPDEECPVRVLTTMERD